MIRLKKMKLYQEELQNEIVSELNSLIGKKFGTIYSSYIAIENHIFLSREYSIYYKNTCFNISQLQKRTKEDCDYYKLEIVKSDRPSMSISYDKERRTFTGYVSSIRDFYSEILLDIKYYRKEETWGSEKLRYVSALVFVFKKGKFILNIEESVIENIEYSKDKNYIKDILTDCSEINFLR